jgi:PAS domain-containing protein
MRRLDAVSQKEIEVILTRQLASCLAMPVFIVDPDGNLIFYNEPAEFILGRRFEETGEMPVDELATIFKPIDAAGGPLPAESLPIWIALRQRRLAHGQMWIRGLDGVRRHIETVAFPLIGYGQRNLGAVVIFQEVAQQ